MSANRLPVLLQAALLVLAPLVGALGGPDPAAAQLRLVDGGPGSLTLSGYVRSLTGVHDAGYRIPGGDARSGFNGEVLRLRWRARWGERLALEVHDRFQARVSTAPREFGSSVAGFGVSAFPGRAVDLESVWIDDDRLRVWHDLDRLAVSVYTPVADVTVGRQAVTWGTSLLFPVADLWGRFSPFELDTEEKPGVDAVRVLSYPAPGLEVDAVVADRGARDDVSAGVRATWSLAEADVYAAGGRIWDEAMVGGGVAWLLEVSKVRAEILAARDLETDRWLDPRLTVGVDRIGPELTLTAEYHFNGLGAPEPAGYLERLGGERFARGESYFLGRHYLGGLASWTLDEDDRATLSASLLMNVEDGSGALSPAFGWDLGPGTSLSLGGLVTTGEVPAFDGALPRIRSEYGTYGDLLYTRLSVYF